MYYQCRNNSRGGFLIPLVGGILIGGLISPYFYHPNYYYPPTYQTGNFTYPYTNGFYHY